MRHISLPVIVGILFTAIGTATFILFGEALTAAIWLSFGNGLLLSSLHFKGTDAAGQQVAQPIPKERMFFGVFLIVLAVLLLVLQVYLDLSAAA